MTGERQPLRYPFRIGRRSRPFLRLWAVEADRDAVVIDGEEMRVDFGFAHLRFPVANVARWRIEGPWSWITAIGIRRGFRSGDISLQGSPRGGVRVDFRERISWGPLRIPALYVGVEDLEGLAAELAARGIPGEDARTRRAP